MGQKMGCKYGQPEGSRKSLSDVARRGNKRRRVPGQTESPGQLRPKRRIDLRGCASRGGGWYWRPAASYGFDFSGIRHFRDEQRWKLLTSLGDDVVVERLTAIDH